MTLEDNVPSIRPVLEKEEEDEGRITGKEEKENCRGRDERKK